MSSGYGAFGDHEQRRESITARESAVNNAYTSGDSSVPISQTNNSNDSKTNNNFDSNNNNNNNNNGLDGSNNNSNSNKNLHSDLAVSHGISQPEQATRAVRFVKWYIGCLFYLRYPLLLTWTLIVLMCALAAGNLTQNLNEEMNPPDGSPALIANQNYQAWWPSSVTTTAFLIFFDTTRIRAFDLTKSAQFFAFDCFVEYWGKTGSLDFSGSIDPLVLLTNMTTETNLSTYSSWRVVESAGFWGPSILDYLGQSNFSIVAAAALTTRPTSDETFTFYRDFNKAMPDLLAKANLSGQLDVSLVGLPSFMEEINEASTRDVLVMFGVVVPIALIIFCFSLDSLRFGLLGLCSLVSTLMLTFACIDSVAQTTQVSTIVPGVVGALCISLSSDFTYMLVSKFRREVVLESAQFLDDPSGFVRGMIFVDPKHVMVMVMACAGRVVFITGLSVAFASCGMIFFPLTVISSIGIGCLITAIMAVLVSLILTPTLLVTFYRFFATGAEQCEWPNFGKGKKDHHGQYSDSDGGSYYHSIPSSQVSLATTHNEITNVDNNNNNTTSAVGVVVGITTNDPVPSQQISGKKNEKSALISASSENHNNRNNNNNNSIAAPSFTGSFANGRNANHLAVVTNADGTEIPIAIPPSLSGAGDSSQEPSSPTSQVRNAIRAANRANHTGAGDQKDLPLVSLSRDAVSRVQVQLRDKRLFYRDFYAFLCQPRVAILSILIVLAICVYPMTKAFEGRYSNGMDQFVPRDSALLPAWKSMERNFPFSDVFPYHFLIYFNTVKTYTHLSDDAPSKQGQDIVARILEVPGTSPRGVESFFYDPHLVGITYTADDYPNGTDLNVMPGSVNVTSAQTVGCFKNSSACLFKPSLCASVTPYCRYRAVIYQIRSGSETKKPVADVYVRVRMSPTSAEGREFVKNMRAKLAEIEASYDNVSLFLSGFGGDSYDLVDYAHDHIVAIVAILVSCAWFIVTVFFFSLGASLRLLISFVFTFFTIFGLATIIFVDGALSSWPVPAGLLGAEGSECWLVPFCAVALNIATILNYDVQATMRVQQFRHQGIATRSAIVIAAIEGSNEVFVAASMTIVSFIGLLFSQVPTMNQLGFYFVFGAFLQGIVFRLFLVAPVMSLLGELNWFPYMQISQKIEGLPVTFTGPTNEGPLEDGNPYRETLGVYSSSESAIHHQSASRNPSVLAPPGARSAIVDNEALIWAARESGLDPRRISNMNNNNNNNNIMGGESYDYYNYDPNRGSQQQQQQRQSSQQQNQNQRAQSSLTRASRPPLDFIFSSPTNNGRTSTAHRQNATNQNQTAAGNQSFAGIPNTVKKSSSNKKESHDDTNSEVGGTKKSKVGRSSLAPGNSSPDM